jgi:hypothetical protein
MGLTRREHHIDGIAERINEDVNFGSQPAAGPADRLRAPSDRDQALRLIATRRYD